MMLHLWNCEQSKSVMVVSHSLEIMSWVLATFPNLKHHSNWVLALTVLTSHSSTRGWHELCMSFLGLTSAKSMEIQHIDCCACKILDHWTGWSSFFTSFHVHLVAWMTKCIQLYPINIPVVSHSKPISSWCKASHHLSGSASRLLQLLQAKIHRLRLAAARFPQQQQRLALLGGNHGWWPMARNGGDAKKAVWRTKAPEVSMTSPQEAS